MSSNLKVNNILPSTGDTVAVSGIASVTSSVSIASSCTATTFYGSGANLTGISALSLANGADNRLVTATGAAALTGESTLTYDGTSAFELQPSSATPARFIGDSNRTAQGQHLAHFEGNWNGTLVGRMVVVAGEDTDNKDDGHLDFYTTPSGGSNARRLRIDSSGRLLVNTTSGHGQFQVHDGTIVHSKPSGGGTRNYRFVNNNTAAGDYGIQISTTSGGSTYANHTELKAGGDVHIHDGNLVVASGHGIDFSATSGGSGGSSEILTDYEQGTFTATLSASGGGATFSSGHIQSSCLYVKIGSMVHVQGYFSGVNCTAAGSGIVKVSGLPFASNNTTYYTICLTHNTVTSNSCVGAYVQYSNTYFFPIVTNGTTGSSFNVGNPRYLMFGGSYPTAF